MQVGLPGILSVTVYLLAPETDTITSISPQEKHRNRDIYLVTGRRKDKVSAQRLLHPLSSTPIKFMSREYTSNPKHIRHVPVYHIQFEGPNLRLVGLELVLMTLAQCGV